MKQSKLLNTIGALNKMEFRDLKKFMQTPYFVEVKQKKKVLQLFDILRPYYPGFDHKQLEKEKVYQQIFPGSPYSTSKMDRLMTRLLAVVRRFIVFESTLKKMQSGEEDLILARFYSERKLKNDFQNSIRQFETRQNQIQVQTPDFFLNDYLMQVEKSAFAGFYNQRKADLNLPSTLRSLDIFYISSHLQHACSLLTQHLYHVPLELENKLLKYEEITRYIESNDYLDVPLIAVFYYAFQLLYLKDDNEIFEKLLEALNKYEDDLPAEQLKAIQTICRSYCVRRCNKGEAQYLPMAFDLYKAHLESGHLYHDNGIFAGKLKNLVTIGLKMKQYDWVYDIINSHRNRIIGTKHPEEVYRFNLSSYYFAKKAYNKALEYLSGYEDDTYYKVSAKRLELKVYYELKSPILESKMSAFKIYLFRVSDKILSEVAKEGNNNFINLLRRIHNPQTRFNPERIDKLLNKISSLGAVTDRDWLIEQLEKMR